MLILFAQFVGKGLQAWQFHAEIHAIVGSGGGVLARLLRLGFRGLAHGRRRHAVHRGAQVGLHLADYLSYCSTH